MWNHNRHTRLIALLVFLVQLFVSHPASIYLYNQFQDLRPSGLRLSGLPLSHQHSYPTLSSALNIFFRRRISLSFKNGIIRLEAGAFKFLRNRLFITSMQLPRKRDVPSSAISKNVALVTATSREQHAVFDKVIICP